VLYKLTLYLLIYLLCHLCFVSDDICGCVVYPASAYLATVEVIIKIRRLDDSVLVYVCLSFCCCVDVFYS